MLRSEYRHVSSEVSPGAEAALEVDEEKEEKVEEEQLEEDREEEDEDNAAAEECSFDSELNDEDWGDVSRTACGRQVRGGSGKPR